VVEDGFEESCTISVADLGEIRVVEVSGEVDIATASLLAKALGDASRPGQEDVIVDARELTYIDSACLGTLLATRRKLVSEGRRMAIVGCHGVFYKLIKLSHLDLHFSMYATMDEAVSALKAP
jgi:anti-sigma B factor antagonist